MLSLARLRAFSMQTNVNIYREPSSWHSFMNLKSPDNILKLGSVSAMCMRVRKVDLSYIEWRVRLHFHFQSRILYGHHKLSTTRCLIKIIIFPCSEWHGIVGCFVKTPRAPMCLESLKERKIGDRTSLSEIQDYLSINLFCRCGIHCKP